MCRVSGNIKFCTCDVEKVDDLKHYWVLHRYNSSKEDIVIGQAMLPYDIDRETDLRNKATLLKRINEADAFVVDLHPKDKDRLELTSPLMIPRLTPIRSLTVLNSVTANGRKRNSTRSCGCGITTRRWPANWPVH